MINTQVSYKKQKLLTQREPLGSPSFFGGACVAHFSVFCVVLCDFCLSLFSVVFPMLPVSLDCSFLIAPSILSNVYFCSNIPTAPACDTSLRACNSSHDFLIEGCQ